MALEKIDAQTQLKNYSPGGGGASLYGSRYLVGVANSTNPNYQYDISAHQVTLWNPDTDETVLVSGGTGILTCDKNVAGPTANGRDQVGTFTDNTFISLYFIWNGTTLATLFSASAPSSLPTLPAGYTHLCYVGTLKLLGSNIISMKIRGNRVYYSTQNIVLNGGQSTSLTSVSMPSSVPSVATNVDLLFTLYTDSEDSTLEVGIENASLLTLYTMAASYQNLSLRFGNHSIYYGWTSGGGLHLLDIQLIAFEVPNGAS